MSKTNQIVQKIQQHYVGDDCVQVMVPYKKEIVMLNESGITFSHKAGSEIYINSYMNDERRKQFPYSNIPTHYSRVGLLGKMTFANQLLDYEKPYIRLADSTIIESYAVKDKNESLLINKVISSNTTTLNMTRDELEQLFNEQEKGKYIIHLDNEIKGFYQGIQYPIPNEDKIKEFMRKEIKYCCEEFRDYINKHQNNGSYSMVAHFLEEHPLFLDYVEQSINYCDLDPIKTEIGLKGGKAIIVDFNTSSIKIVRAEFNGIDSYLVYVAETPITKFTLEQLKNLAPKIARTKEPRIPLKLNQGISKQDIIEAKQMVKSLRK